MPITTIETGLYEGLILSELLNRSQDRLKQKRGNFDRYSKQAILDALNDGQVETAKRLRCLHGIAVIVLKAGRSQYKPPSQMLIQKKAFFYKSSTSYYELPPTTRNWLDDFKRGWRTVNGDPLMVFPGDNYGNMRKIGFYPRPKTDGSAYSTGSDADTIVNDTSAETTGNIAGQNSVASATICTDDAGRTLDTLGVKVGMMAVNVNTGESGQISAVTGATFTIVATDFPTGWVVGDNFTVLAGEYGTVVSWDGEEEYIYPSDYGATLDIQHITNNVYLEFYRRPLLLKYDTQYPEIPPDLHQYLPDYVPFVLKRNAPQGSTDQAEANIAYQAFITGMKSYINPEATTSDNCVRYSL